MSNTAAAAAAAVAAGDASSALSSNLSQIGYDMVVATTQKSINATMLQYLDGSDKIEPTVKCYAWKKVVDPTTKKKSEVLTEITLADLANAAPGVDPFAIADDADPDSDVFLQRLRFANFALAYVRACKLCSGPLANLVLDRQSRQVFPRASSHKICPTLLSLEKIHPRLNTICSAPTLDFAL